MQRLLVIEANEVSPKVFRTYAERSPASAVASLIRDGRFVETVAGDVPEEKLYPSQTWASMNTGKPFSEHQTYWYNDEKDYSDFYWHAIAQKRRTVLVNTLHSSPLSSFGEDGKFEMVIPDCFAPDDSAKPPSYEPLQRLSRDLTQRNGRRSKLGRTLVSSATAFMKAPDPRRWGLGPRSTKDVGSIILSAAKGERELLRAAQFPLLADIFVREVRQRRPGLGILFTNHVASMQHRYWYALFPGDYSEKLYPPEWVETHGNAIIASMDLLDEWLGVIVRLARQLDYTLLVTTSMGQAANNGLTRQQTGKQRRFMVGQPEIVLKSLDPGQEYEPDLEGAMAPQYTFRYRSAADAAAAEQRIVGQPSSGLSIRCEVSGPKLTVTIKAESADLRIGNRSVPAEEIGFVEFDTDDHHSGRHHPTGSMLVFNDRAGVFDSFADQIDYLDVAPQLKSAWG